MELDVHHLVSPADGEQCAHDDLVEMVLPKHVSVIEQDLFHDVKGDFGNDFFLRSCLEHVFAELDGLEGDLVQDSFA